MEEIKEAFQRVREDMENLYSEIDFLKNNFNELKQELIHVCKIIREISENQERILEDKQTNRQTDKPTHSSTQFKENQTIPTHSSTDSTDIKPLKPNILDISIGNGGVPTDKQTNQQTDRQTDLELKSSYNQEKNPLKDAAQFIGSLDNLKKELHLKFKRLTDQEILIFSTVYQLTEEQGETDYKTISHKLNLSESSIRDYVGRLIKKGIPLEKKKINNKNISLFISPNLKKIASLSTILQLRDI